MRSLTITAVFLALCGPAFASGGANCEAAAGPAKVAVSAGITRGMGAPVFSLTASAEVSDAKVAEDLRSSKFGRDELAQYWLDGEDLRFRLYRERTGDKFGSVEVTIETKAAGDDETYAGTYSISVYEADAGDPLTFDGKITCSVE